MPTIETFRATSGSQTVYWQTGGTAPSPAENTVTVADTYTAAGLVVNESDVLWQWNGADVSQFESQAQFTSGSIGYDLYVETDPDRISLTGNMLVLSASSSGEGLLIWLTTSSLNTNRYIVEMFISGATDEYGGAAVLCEGSASNFHGFGGLAENSTGTSSTWSFKVDDGIVDSAGSINAINGVGQPQVLRIDVLAHDRTIVTGSPGFVANIEGEGSSGPRYSHRLTQNLAGDNNWNSFPTGSNWDGLQLRRFGLAWRGLSGFTTGGTVKIYSMVVRKHPLDGGLRK